MEEKENKYKGLPLRDQKTQLRIWTEQVKKWRERAKRNGTNLNFQTILFEQAFLFEAQDEVRLICSAMGIDSVKHLKSIGWL